MHTLANHPAGSPDQIARSPTKWLWGRISIRFRTRRMRKFERTFALSDRTRIIDLGGTESNWDLIETKPRVLLVNISAEEYTDGQFVSQRGDATALDLPDRSFDVTYSNSVIEHLHNFDQQQLFALEIRRLSPRYYVQTPYKWFPVEPHFLCLCIHWFPKPMYRKLVRWFSMWGWTARPNQADVDQQLDEIRLLTVAEMRRLFPDGQLVRERFLGWTKSLTMMRH